GIKKLLPGHYLSYLSYENSLKIKRYWDVEFNLSEFNSFSECIERFREIFKNAVKRHLISDVPLGCYLSGGFDSTSVSTIASQLINSRLETFTGTFDEGPRYTEIPCSRTVASGINAKIHEVVIRAEEFIDNIYNIVYHLDEPTIGTGPFPQYLVSKLVSEHVKVVLTGHGGDELFCGYEVFKASYYKDLIKKNPLNILKFLTSVKANELARIMYFLFYPFFQRAVQYGLFIMFDKNERKRLFTNEFYSQMKDYDSLGTIRKILNGKKLNRVERSNYLYLKTYLPTLFILEDKVGMAHSIEARTPICDNELVDFALSLPVKYKLYNNELKAIVKEGMREKLPLILYEQPKKGFPTPFAIWFRKQLKQFAYDILLGEITRRRGVFNMRYIKELLDRHCNLKTNTLYDYTRANKIFSLLTIELWFRIFIDRDMKY
ncbi:MAG: asparagine synthase C-terminal domain-containing protein, partial [bacterium]